MSSACCAVYCMLRYQISRAFLSPTCRASSAVPQPPSNEPTLGPTRSEEHTSELQSLMRISYAVFCLKKKKRTYQVNHVNTFHHPDRTYHTTKATDHAYYISHVPIRNK